MALALSLAVATPTGAQSGSAQRVAAVVQAARSVYRDVESALVRRQLLQRDTIVTCPRSGLEAHASVFRDHEQRVRRLDTDGGTDDHSETVSTYFDVLGRPRFSFAHRGAVNGTSQEERVYYDERGHVVQRQVRRLRGPGYPFDTLTAAPQLASFVRDLCG